MIETNHRDVLFQPEEHLSETPGQAHNVAAHTLAAISEMSQADRMTCVNMIVANVFADHCIEWRKNPTIKGMTSWFAGVVVRIEQVIHRKRDYMVAKDRVEVARTEGRLHQGTDTKQ